MFLVRPHRLADGTALEQAVCQTVASFTGSVAIGCHTADHPDKLLMALRGSGQGLYIGLAEDAFVVASEPYGVVEETPFYLRMNGESAGGEVVALSRDLAGELGGIRRLAYDGSELPVQQTEITKAEITTRDIARKKNRRLARSMSRTIVGCTVVNVASGSRSWSIMCPMTLGIVMITTVVATRKTSPIP